MVVYISKYRHNETRYIILEIIKCIFEYIILYALYVSIELHGCIFNHKSCGVSRQLLYIT